MTTRQDSRTVLVAGVFWGSVWGLYEATAGWLVHNLIRVPGAASVLLVPFAVVCLHRALVAGGTARAAGVAAATAAMIKLVDFVLPSLTLLSIVNPATAILLEGLAFVLIARWLGHPHERLSLRAAAVGAVAFNTAWRVGFLFYWALLGLLWSVGPMRDGVSAPVGFLVRVSLASSAVIVGLVLAGRTDRAAALARRGLPGARATAAVFALAVVSELVTAHCR